MATVPRKWVVYLNGQRLAGGADDRTVAMNRVDRPYRSGPAIIQNETTGEEWQRRRGTWVKVVSADKHPPRRPVRA